MLRQRTLNNSIRATGIGLHTGKRVSMTVHPAAVDRGIVFRRGDLDPAVEIPARVAQVGDTRLATTLVDAQGVRVQTVEHLLAAMAGLGIDNAMVELSADELPIMDGSAGPLVFLLQSAGIVEQAAPKRFLRVTRTVAVSDGDQWARLDPHEGFVVSCAMDFDHPLFGGELQAASVDFSTTAFVREISRARTFGFVRDYAYLRENNLARGGSLDNAVLVDDERVLNADGLRYRDEPARHKVLDAIGDLYLLGRGLIGGYRGHKAGHALNTRLVAALLAAPDAWEEVVYEDSEALPISYIGAGPVVAAA